MQSFGEWLPDLPDYENPGATVANGVYPALKSYCPIGSLSAISSNALASRCLGATSLKSSNGTSITLAGDATKLYKLSAGALTDISKSGGYTTNEEQRWRFAQFGDNIIASNGYDPIQRTTFPVVAAFEDLSADAPKAKFIAVVRDFLMTFNISGLGQRVQWSAINDVTGWTVGTSQSDYQDLPDGGPITAGFGGEYGLVFQESKITRITYVGSPVIFQFDPIELNHGCIEPNSAVQYGRNVFYLSHNGFYMCDGTQAIAIGDQKVDKTFFADLDATYSFNMSAAIDPVNKLVMWAYPGSGHTGGLPNKVIIYNWSTQRWSDADISVNYIFTYLTEDMTLEQLDTITTDLDALGYSLDSKRWRGGVLGLGAFGTTHYLSDFTGSNIAATLETPEAELTPGIKTRVRFTRPIVDSTCTVQIGHRATIQDSVTWDTAVTVNSRGRCATRVYDRYLRGRLNIAAAATWTHAQGLDFGRGNVFEGGGQ